MPASLAVIILNLAAQTRLQALRSPPHSEGDARTPLTVDRLFQRQDLAAFQNRKSAESIGHALASQARTFPPLLVRPRRSRRWLQDSPHLLPWSAGLVDVSRGGLPGQPFAHIPLMQARLLGKLGWSDHNSVRHRLVEPEAIVEQYACAAK